MQEDDENVEVWYLMGVAFNSLQPPDLDSARYVFSGSKVILWWRLFRKDGGYSLVSVSVSVLSFNACTVPIVAIMANSMAFYSPGPI